MLKCAVNDYMALIYIIFQDITNCAAESGDFKLELLHCHLLFVLFFLFMFMLINATFQDLTNRLLSTDFSRSAFSVPPLSPRKSLPESTTFDWSSESLDDHSKVCGVFAKVV